MIKIVPAILTNSLKEAKNLIVRSEDVVKRVHIDIIDGVFANNKTIEPSLIGNLETNLKIDFHLMTREPIDWIERCVRGMADRIIGHVELMNDQVEFVGKVQEVGLSVGLAIDINTPVTKIDTSIINNLDLILVMFVPAGFGGQKFDKRALPKIIELSEIRSRDDTPFTICVDGGERLDTINEVKVGGVDEVVIGRKLFEGDLKTNIEKYLKAAYE